MPWKYALVSLNRLKLRLHELCERIPYKITGIK